MIGVLYAVASIATHRRLGTGMDLAIFYEPLHRMAYGGGFVSTMKAPGFVLFGDHFHPILLVLVPLVRAWDSPEALLAAQAACIGLTAAILARAAQRRLGGPTGLLIGMAFGVSAGVQLGAGFDMHEVALGMPLLALGLVRLLDGRHTSAVLLLASLVLVKEDSAFLLLGAGLALAMRGRRRHGAALAAFGIAWSWVVTSVVIPAFHPDHRYAYAGAIDPTRIPEALQMSLVRPGTGLAACVIVLAGAGLVAARSPLILVAAASVAVRMITPNPNYHQLAFHYWLLPSVAVFAALIDAYPRGKGRRLVAALVAAVAMVSVLLGPTRSALIERECSRCGSAQTALAQIPDGARVGADVYLTSHLAGRALVNQVRPNNFTDDTGRPIDVDWLVLDEATISYGGGWVKKYVASLGPEWREVFHEAGYVVLRRFR